MTPTSILRGCTSRASEYAGSVLDGQEPGARAAGSSVGRVRS